RAVYFTFIVDVCIIYLLLFIESDNNYVHFCPIVTMRLAFVRYRRRLQYYRQHSSYSETLAFDPDYLDNG
ncbi:hypothetical protein OFN56_39735, partial [Escherichia coli]|nr:hypothetical protein [Escherichia coli]